MTVAGPSRSLGGVRALGPVLLLMAAVAAGCGGSGTGELLERLPSDTPLLATIDLAAAREQLGLPDDADPTAPNRDAQSAERRLLFAAGYALPHLQRPFDLPILDALDESQIEAAATAGLRGEDQLTVVRTGQPADEVLDGLERGGYRRQGDVVASGESPFKVVYAAAAESDGLLLLGGSRAAVRRALEGEAAGAGPARKLMDELDGALRVAATGSGSGCVRGVAGGERLKPSEGDLLLRVEGVARPERSPLGDGAGLERELARNAHFEKPTAEGDLLRIPFSYDTRKSGLSPLALVTGDAVAGALYRCEG